MVSAWARMREDGQVRIPIAVLRAAGLERGGDVAIEVTGGEIRLRLAATNEAPEPAERAVELAERVRKLRAMSRVLIGDYSGSAVDALIAERRLAFAKEEAELARYGL